MKRIKWQQEDSNVFGVKIGRNSRLDSFEPEEFVKEILDEKYDVCYIKIPMEDSAVFAKLECLGFYYSPFTIISRTRIALTKEHENIEIPEEVVFELFEGNREEEVRQLLAEGFAISTGGNYVTSLYESLFPYKDFIDASINYYLGFNSRINPDKTMYILRNEQRYIGCCCLDYSEEEVDVSLLLTHPDFRNTGYTQLMMRQATQSAYLRGRSYGAAGASLHNLPSLKAQLSFGMKLSKSYLNVVLYPFLTSSDNLIKEDVEANIASSALLDMIKEYAVEKGVAELSDCTFKTKQHATVISNAKAKVYVSNLQKTGNDFFIAGKMVDENSGQLLMTFFLKS